VSFVDVALGPSKNAKSFLFILEPFSLILVTSSWPLLPNSLPTPQAILEATFEVTA
jgi:hypothetical protein